MTLTMCLKLKFYHVNFVGVCSCHKNNTRFLLEARIALAFIFSLQINTSLLPLPFFLFPEWSQFFLSKKEKNIAPTCSDFQFDVLHIKSVTCKAAWFRHHSMPMPVPKFCTNGWKLRGNWNRALWLALSTQFSLHFPVNPEHKGLTGISVFCPLSFFFILCISVIYPLYVCIFSSVFLPLFLSVFLLIFLYFILCLSVFRPLYLFMLSSVFLYIVLCISICCPLYFYMLSSVFLYF